MTPMGRNGNAFPIKSMHSLLNYFRDHLQINALGEYLDTSAIQILLRISGVSGIKSEDCISVYYIGSSLNIKHSQTSNDVCGTFKWVANEFRCGNYMDKN